MLLRELLSVLTIKYIHHRDTEFTAYDVKSFTTKARNLEITKTAFIFYE
jgi:hypothetical protein